MSDDAPTTKKKVTRKRTTKKKVAPAGLASLGADDSKKKATSKKTTKKSSTSKASSSKAGNAPAADTTSKRSGDTSDKPAEKTAPKAASTDSDRTGRDTRDEQRPSGNQDNNASSGDRQRPMDLREKQQQRTGDDDPNRRRRRRRKRKGGGQGGQGHGGGGLTPRFKGIGPTGIPSSVLPYEDNIRADIEQFEEFTASADFEKQSKDAVNLGSLVRMPINELHEYAEEEGVEEVHKLARPDLIYKLVELEAAKERLLETEGTLQIVPEGFGFVRFKETSYTPSPTDAYVCPTLIRKHGLRSGVELRGYIRPPAEDERFFAMLKIEAINDGDPQRMRSTPVFEDMTPLHPEERFVLETEPDVLETRVVDLVAPIGRGQRALIVAPPRTGKTVLMQKMTKAISQNYPEVKIIVLLIDERPEEVTDFRRNTAPEVEVVASTFDEDAKRHVQVAEMVMEKARRYVEFGEHVVILLDSITRLARAYNAAAPNTGKIMSGGIDSGALTRPKKFFGSARAIEGGGSLTILGTALVDTGSKADEVIFEEFKGTGNSELHLDRKLVEKRVYPAIDVAASGTRREELLLDPKELELVYRLRKVLSDMNVVEAMELMKSRLSKSKTNAEFLITMNLG